MSEQGEPVHVWELPSFEPAGPASPAVDPAEEEARARARGFEEGRAEGLHQGTAEARQLVQQVNDLLDGMVRPYRNLDQLVTQELVRTAMAMARQILGRELALDSKRVADAVSEAVATLSSLEGEIEIQLNPADIALVRELAPQVLEGRSWKLQEDPELLPGGCRLKTPVSYVDASVEKQMEAVLATLLEACDDDSPEN